MKNLYALLALVLIIGLAAQPMSAQREMFGPEHSGLMFVSHPPPFARVGVPYVYTAVARSMDTTAVIRYSWDPGNPAGFGIDSVTGVVSWTPAARGWFEIKIFAKSDKGETGEQRFVVAVTDGNGVIQGTVKDTAGLGIARVVIELFQAADGDTGSLPNFALPGCFSYVTKTDSLGNYRIANIEPGIYKLHATSPTPQYASQWYDGKATAAEANRITIPDSPSVTVANFILRAGEMHLPFISVSGTVSDTVLKPLKDAIVGFVRAGFALNSNATAEDFRQMFDLNGRDLDFRMEGFSPHVFRTKSDSLGAYKIKLPPGIYIAFARAQGYAVEFYLDQSSVLTATRLMLKADTTGIDFTLAPLPPVVYGTIQGTVLDTAKGIGVRARIIATRDGWPTPDMYRAPRCYTVDTDSLGVYSLENLLPGSYIVFALPVGNYAPAFYSTDTSTAWWRRATRVPVNGNTVTGIDIYVHEMPARLRGYAGITGQINMSDGPASAAAGTIVYATTGSTVAGYGIADETGRYIVFGLAPGTYTVSADLPGTELIGSKSATVSYSSTGAPLGAVVDLSLSVVTDVSPVAERPVEFTLAQNYPNPFNPSTMISYQLPTAGHVDLRVYDILGREVAVLVNGVQTSGTHSVTFNASSLASGVYMYRLTTGSMTATKKMLLMK
jgi:protocatechuate 3,4-dioxygenase beta subunit